MPKLFNGCLILQIFGRFDYSFEISWFSVKNALWEVLSSVDRVHCQVYFFLF